MPTDTMWIVEPIAATLLISYADTVYTVQKLKLTVPQSSLQYSVLSQMNIELK